MQRFGGLPQFLSPADVPNLDPTSDAYYFRCLSDRSVQKLSFLIVGRENYQSLAKIRATMQLGPTPVSHLPLFPPESRPPPCSGQFS